MGRKSPPRRVIVNFLGIDHEMNVPVLRLALVRCQVAGQFHSMEQLADLVGVSRSTVSRFFAGRPTSLTIALEVLNHLNVKFEEVFTPVNLDPV